MKINNALTVLVISPDPALSTFLEEKLHDSRYEIVNCRPGSKFAELASRSKIAIVDRINERPEAARREIAVLKKIDPTLPIIAVSEKSSDRDARVVNQGVFYYLAGYSEQKLLRIVYAAAESLKTHSKSEKQKTK